MRTRCEREGETERERGRQKELRCEQAVSCCWENLAEIVPLSLQRRTFKGKKRPLNKETFYMGRGRCLSQATATHPRRVRESLLKILFSLHPPFPLTPKRREGDPRQLTHKLFQDTTTSGNWHGGGAAVGGQAPAPALLGGGRRQQRSLGTRGCRAALALAVSAGAYFLSPFCASPSSAASGAYSSFCFSSSSCSHLLLGNLSLFSFFPLHPPVLEPDFDLSLCQSQRM